MFDTIIRAAPIGRIVLAGFLAASGATTVLAQGPQTLAAAQDPTKTVKPAAPAAAGPRLLRSETTTHDFWTVGCDHFAAGPTPRCAARMPVLKPGNARQVLVVASVSKGPNDQWFFNLHIPPNIVIQPGVEIRFGDKPARKLALQSCEPALCTASTPLDPALRAELTGAQKATAVWTSIAAGEVKADFPLKGAAPALTALLK